MCNNRLSIILYLYALQYFEEKLSTNVDKKKLTVQAGWEIYLDESNIQLVAVHKGVSNTVCVGPVWV
jgi:hypothetical protein